MKASIRTCAFLAIISLIHSCGGGSSSTPTPTPTTCTSTQRTFTITNSTSEEIWLGMTAGTISCLEDSDCPTGASGSCVGAAPPTAGVCGCSSDTQCGSIAACSNSKCYYNLPTMTTAQMDLAAGASTTVCFPAPASGSTSQWSGNIFARTGCDSNGQNCKTGECGNAAGEACPTGTGGNPPATLAEFTLSNQTSFTTTPGDDFYDISIINGINVGITMSPVSGTYSATSGNAYSCASAGSTTASSGGLSACTWTVTPTVSSTDYTTLLRDVSPTSFTGDTCPAGGSPNSLGYCACTADSGCTASSLVCGLAMNASTGVQYTQVCGTGIGWWTADQLCGSTNGTSPALDPLDCATNTDLYLCTGAQAASCYTSGAAATCCGCATSASADNADWPSVLSPNFGGSDNGCYNNNSTWVTSSQPWLVFLKRACPTAYTYPYDDATSTFTCLGSATVGAPEYTVTFITAN